MSCFTATCVKLEIEELQLPNCPTAEAIHDFEALQAPPAPAHSQTTMLSFSTTTKLTLTAAAAFVLVSQSTVVSAASSSCVPSSCAIGQYPPATGVSLVCGSDGVTYSSQCELELAACAQPELTLASQGVCNTKCDQECDAHESLICGSDGVTYQNACEFDRAYCKDKTLTPLGYGTCKKSSRSLRDSKPKYIEGSII